MKNKTPAILIISGGFLFLDQYFKWQSLHAWVAPKIFWKYFGWYPFLNPGVAFSLPVPNSLTLVVSLPVVLGLAWWLVFCLVKNKNILAGEFFGLVLVLFGAVSNLADRLIYKNTVDYLKFYTGVINLADVMIVVGFIIFFRAHYKKA